MGMVEYFPFFQIYNNYKYYEYVLYPDTKKNAWKKNKSHKLMGRNWAAFNGQAEEAEDYSYSRSFVSHGGQQVQCL